MSPVNTPDTLSAVSAPVAVVSASRSLSSPAITFYDRDESEPIVIPGTANTLDGFREWALSDEFPERGKISFVADEVIVDMSPEAMEDHSDIKTEIARVLSALVRESKLGHLHIDGVLVSNKQAGVSNEPDILFVSKDTMRSGKIQLTRVKNRPQSSKEIVGTVDWVLEIVSPSSKKKDKVLLRDAYYRAGIGEYWLVDALNEEIEFQLLVPGETEYVAVAAQEGWLTSPTFGKSFKLERETDADGFLEYTLHMQ